jgi:hypothetical protein
VPTLANIDGATLSEVPDLSGLQGLSQAFQSRAKNAELSGLIDVLSDSPQVQAAPEESLVDKALGQLDQLSPALANGVRSVLGSGDEEQIGQLRQEGEKGGADAKRISALPTHNEKIAAISQDFQRKVAEGTATQEEADRVVQLSNLSEDGLNLELQKMEVTANALNNALPPAPDTSGIFGTPEKQAAFMRLAALDPAAAETLLRGEDSRRAGLPAGAQAGPPGGDIVKSSEITDGFIVQRQPDGSFKRTKVLEVASTSDSAGKASAVTKIFDNGTTIQALPNGRTVVKDQEGNIVQGEARIDALRAARQEEISFGQTKAGATAAGTAAIRQSEKSFERLGNIKIAIGNIDKAIDAIDEGAETGFIKSKLPSIRDSSIKLDNLQKAMGLDVIGTATFGALSKGELDLALSKAIPTTLKPQALRLWLVDKKQAQEKLSSYLEDAAIFLGTPGNTIAGWVEAQEAISSQASEQVTQQTPPPEPGAVSTGQATPEGFEIFQRPNGSTFAVSP